MSQPLTRSGVGKALKATLTPLETMAVTGFGVHATYEMLRAGKMPHIRVGKKFYIPRAALQRWLESCGGRDAA